MNDVKIEPFDFKIPAIPGRTHGNVIPTGKQIPRTPIKVENNNVPIEEHQNVATSVDPSGSLNCISMGKKNWIPKGREIPRTPLNKIIPVQSSSSDSRMSTLPESYLGVRPLHELCESDVIDYNVEISILTGKINIRKTQPLKKDVDEETQNASKENIRKTRPLKKDVNEQTQNASKENIRKTRPLKKDVNEQTQNASKENIRKTRPLKKDVDEETQSASKENKDCISSSKVRKARSKGKSLKDAPEQLCKDMETKCVLSSRRHLQNVSNEETSIRRNPSRRAKANVNYKL